jgi:hypothetical protein
LPSAMYRCKVIRLIFNFFAASRDELAFMLIHTYNK